VDKRIVLKVVSLLLLLIYLLGFAWLGTQQLRAFSLQAEYVGVISNLPSRFHSQMGFTELNHFSEVITELTSGPGSAQGLEVIPNLNAYLSVTKGQSRFDLEAVVNNLRAGNLRVAQSLLVELSVRVEEAHAQNRTRLVLLFLAGLIGCYAMASLVAHFFGRTKVIEHQLDGKSVEIEDIQPSSALGVAVHNVSDLESVKSGHDYVLELKGDDLIKVTDQHYPLIEAVICEMVRNAIVHGGRASAVRQAAGKPGTIKIFIGIKQDKDQWVITIADDGEGIDEMHVMQHAVAKDIVSQDALRKIEAGHGVKLILLEGFSNANENKAGPLKSNSLAGIRESVQALGGTVSLRNRPSVFCEFTLKVPV